MHVRLEVGKLPRPDDTPLLGAKWINARIENVFNQALSIWTKIIEDVTFDGFLPFESPPDAETLKRLTPEQKEKMGMSNVHFTDEGTELPPGLVPPDMIEALPPAPQPLAGEQTIL